MKREGRGLRGREEEGERRQSENEESCSCEGKRKTLDEEQ